MTEELDLTLARSGSFFKKGYSFIVSNAGKTVAAITLLVTALVSFTEISLGGIDRETFTSTVIMMLIASYVMYFSLEDAGERLARESDAYKETSERHSRLEKELKQCDIAALRDFCLDYTKAELEYRRSNALFALGYTKEEYEAYLGGAKTSEKAVKALRRVEKIKRAELSAATLLSQKAHTESELKNPERSRLLGMLLRLVPSTLCMLFTVSVMVSVKDNLTAAGVIEAILKLSTLPIIGLKGYSGGYEYVTNNEVAWLETKSRLIEAFLKTQKP